MSARFPTFALLAGNLVIGLSILGPAGMIDPLAADLGVTVGQAAFLITGGAVVLCLGSPLVAWATSTVDRRRLLSLTLAALAACHVASALAPDYSVLFAVRIVAMGFAAIFTPQAASAIAMLVPEKDRPGAISFVFLGWSLAAAAGLPLVAWFSATWDWRIVHWGLAALGACSALAVHASLPSGLRAAPMSLASWGVLFRDRLVLSLLAATILASSGQFVVVTYFGPLLDRMTGASPAEIAMCFAGFGVGGFLGNVAASRMVGRIGALATSVIFFAIMLLGASIWTAGSGWLVAMALGGTIWGLGFAASNSMQQARLAVAAPAVAGAAIALNSSSIYIGQASGSALGAFLFERGAYIGMGATAMAFLAVTLLLVMSTGRVRAPAG